MFVCLSACLPSNWIENILHLHTKTKNLHMFLAYNLEKKYTKKSFTYTIRPALQSTTKQSTNPWTNPMILNDTKNYTTTYPCPSRYSSHNIHHQATQTTLFLLFTLCYFTTYVYCNKIKHMMMITILLLYSTGSICSIAWWDIGHTKGGERRYRTK